LEDYLIKNRLDDFYSNGSEGDGVKILSSVYKNGEILLSDFFRALWCYTIYGIAWFCFLT
jgi:hypothetical protein